MDLLSFFSRVPERQKTAGGKIVVYRFLFIYNYTTVWKGVKIVWSLFLKKKNWLSDEPGATRGAGKPESAAPSSGKEEAGTALTPDFS